jgi:hypothetical protein
MPANWTLYVYAHKDPGLPHSYRIFLLGEACLYTVSRCCISPTENRSREHSGNLPSPVKCGFLRSDHRRNSRSFGWRAMLESLR